VKWFHRWLVINRRVLLWGILLLALIDVGIRVGEGVWFTLETQRLPADDQATVVRWKEQLQDKSEFKVLFIGDSVVFGGGVKEAADTLPALFARQLMTSNPDKDIKVVNCSLPGNTPADAWVMSRFLADTRPDLVVYDANLGWFGNQTVMEHPGLTKLPGVRLVDEDWSRLQAAKPTTPGLEDRLASGVAQGWVLYRDRLFLNYWLWGQPYNEKIKQALQYKSARLLLPHQLNPQQHEQLLPWDQKNTASLKASQGVLGSVALNASNPHWYYYQRLLADWQGQGSQVIVFAVPRNQTLLAQYKVINQQKFYPNQEQMLKAAKINGAAVFDYTKGVVADDDFTDTVHPTAQGNQQLARRLYRDVTATGWLQSLLAKEQ